MPLSLLHIANGRIVDNNNQAVFLRGLNTAGLEFGDGISQFTQARITAFAALFSMNLWRLAINVAWWNSNVLMSDGVTHYQAWIQTVIGWMKAAGCYVEIDPTTWMTLPPTNSGSVCSANGLNPPQTSIGTDTFTRGNQSGWGTASDGSAWTTITGSPTLSIASNEGVMTATGGNDVYMKLGSGSGSDQTGAVRFTMTKTTQPYAGVMLRFSNSNNWYRFYSDTSSLIIDTLVGGAYGVLGSIAKPLVSGTSYWLRAYVVGTTLYVRLWQDGITEPNLWDIQVTDSGLASGGVGLFGKTNTGDTLTFDQFATGVPVTSCITHQDTLNFPPWTDAQMIAATETFFTSFIGIYGSDPAILYDAINEPGDSQYDFTDVIAANNAIINFIQDIQPNALIFVADGRMRDRVLAGTADQYTQANLVWDFHLYDDIAWPWQQKLTDFQSTFTYAQAHSHAVTIGEWNAGITNDGPGYGAAIANLVVTQGLVTTYYHADNLLLGDNTTLTTQGQIVQTTYQTIARVTRRTVSPPTIGWHTTTTLAPLSSLALTGAGYGGTVPPGTTSNPVAVRVYNNFAKVSGVADALNCTLAVYDDTTYAGQAINPSTTGGYVQVQVLDDNGNQENADSLFFAIGGQTKHLVPTSGGALVGDGSNYVTVQVQLAVPIDASEGAISPGLWLEYSSTS